MMYEFHLALKKHPKEHKFVYRYPVKKGEDLQALKEKVCMDFEKKFNTPIKCVKVVESGGH